MRSRSSWSRAGYTLGPLVEAPGEAARRGGILDVFPPTEALPLRIELFGDEVESIRRFDPETQRTVERLAQALVGPAREWFPDRHALLDLAGRPRWRHECGERDE